MNTEAHIVAVICRMSLSTDTILVSPIHRTGGRVGALTIHIPTCAMTAVPILKIRACPPAWCGKGKGIGIGNDMMISCGLV